MDCGDDVSIQRVTCRGCGEVTYTPYLVSTVGVNGVDEIPVGILHVLEADIPENTSVVEQNIDAAEVLDGRLNDGLTVLDAVVVGNRLAAGGADLLNDDICGLFTM